MLLDDYSIVHSRNTETRGHKYSLSGLNERTRASLRFGCCSVLPVLGESAFGPEGTRSDLKAPILLYVGNSRRSRRRRP